MKFKFETTPWLTKLFPHSIKENFLVDSVALVQILRGPGGQE